MGTRHCLFLGSSFLLVAAACSSTTTAPANPDSGTPAGGEDASGPDAEPGAETGPTKDAARDSDAPNDAAMPAPEFELDDRGCVTYASAEKFCGFKSDGKICEFAAGCGTTASQCKIDCEMITSVECMTPADGKCIVDAFNAKSCDAANACKWKLWYE